MAQNISETNNFTTNYDVGVPEQTDTANIVQAFTEYHYGPGYNGTGSPGGIEGHLGSISQNLTTHASATSAHGVSGNVVGTTSSQTLTNKTLTSPTINSATINSATINSPTISSPTITTSISTSSSTSYTIALTDASKILEFSAATAISIVIPAESTTNFPVGSSVAIMQTGAGQITVSGAGGVTLNGTPGFKTRAQWSLITLIKRGSNLWVMAGDSVA